MNNFAMDIRQSKLPPLILERQPFVIDAQQVEQRGVEVVHMDAILNDVVTVVVRAPHDGSALGTATGHPE